MTITICKSCGKKYVSEPDSLCDSCKDLRDTIREIDFETDRRERQEKQQYEDSVL